MKETCTSMASIELKLFWKIFKSFQFAFNIKGVKTKKKIMKCLTKLVVLILVLNFADGFTYQRTVRSSDICGYHNGHRKYLELGESGQLSATNVTVPTVCQN